MRKRAYLLLGHVSQELFFLVLGVEPKALHMLSMCTSTELLLQPLSQVFVRLTHIIYSWFKYYLLREAFPDCSISISITLDPSVSLSCLFSIALINNKIQVFLFCCPSTLSPGRQGLDLIPTTLQHWNHPQCTAHISAGNTCQVNE